MKARENSQSVQEGRVGRPTGVTIRPQVSSSVRSRTGPLIREAFFAARFSHRL